MTFNGRKLEDIKVKVVDRAVMLNDLVMLIPLNSDVLCIDTTVSSIHDYHDEYDTTYNTTIYYVLKDNKWE